jgi:anaerobic magnesium-protoporphyrin IX monomethyl ester cyclase
MKMSLNILLIKPVSEKIKIISGVSPPIGIMYLASSLRLKIPHSNIKILDLGVYDKSLRTFLRNFKPNYIGLSATTLEYDYAKKISKKAKELFPNCKIILGGPHASAKKTEVLNDCKTIDYVCIGEGDNSFPNLINAIENNDNLEIVNGIAYRNLINNSKIIETKAVELISDLDSLPYPAWDLIQIKEYGKYHNWNGTLRKKNYMSIVTSRGCPYGCIYCHSLLGKKFRFRSPLNVFDEIKYLYEKYDIREFHFIDQVFNLDSNRCKELCRLIIKWNKKIKISFPDGLRADIVDKELLVLLKKAGTYKIHYALETANARMQEFLGKRMNINKFNQTLKWTYDLGIVTIGNFMIGSPTETKDEILETINFAANSKIDYVRFFFVTPLPGTKLYELSPETNNLRSNLSTPHSCSIYTADELKSLYFYGMIKSYTKISRIFRIIYLEKINGLKKLINIFTHIIEKKIE